MSMGSGDMFEGRHVGPSATQQAEMLRAVGAESLAELIEQTVPSSIQMTTGLQLPEAVSESDALAILRQCAERNQLWKSYIGMGYHACITPPVIRRNLIEDPGWYTAYTPYQAEISQGRLEALLLFQTMVQELTGMEVSNASLLDEATAWRLVSEGPARMLGLLDRGRLEPGLRADLVVMDRATRRIVMTIAAGQVAWLSGEVAARLF